MSARIRLQRVLVASLAALGLYGGLGSMGLAHAQPAAATGEADMQMPDDLGKPLDGIIPTRRPVAPKGDGLMTLQTPIADIAADPRGRAVLQKDLPGLCERPEFVMFKAMTLPELAAMSHGRLTEADLAKVQGDLQAQRIVLVATHRSHNPLTAGERAVGRVTHALYRRVVLVVASL